MTPTRWLLFAGLGLVLVGYTVWNYRRRELPVDGVRGLVGIRSLVFLGLVLLLLNPRLPWGAAADAGAWRLIDVSLSMNAAEGAPWSRVAQPATDGRTVAFGEQPRTIDPVAMSELVADQNASQLLPALQVAAQGGAQSVVVASDLRVSDLGQALTEAARLGVDVGFEDAGEDVVNAGLGEIVFPEVAEADGFDISVAVFGEGLRSGSTVAIEVFEEETRVAATTVSAPTPADGLLRTTLQVPGPTQPGPRIRYRVQVVAQGDQFDPDDERVAYLFSEGEEGGLVFVSWAPDFESRFLLPVLEAATGLRPTLLMRVGEDRFLESGREGITGRSLTEEDVRRRLDRAELAVLHGIGGVRPGWLDAWAGSARSLLVFPGASGALDALQVSASGPLQGQWSVDPVLPASPLAGELAGLRMEALPPLVSSFTIEPVAGGFSPLRVRRDGRGRTEPALLVAERGNRRWAAALTSGYYRWMLRGGAAEEAYRRLWSAVAGWLVTGGPIATGDQVQPTTRVFERGQRITWRAPGLAGDTLELRVQDAGTTVLDTIVVVDGEEHTASGTLGPGTYRYEVRSNQEEGALAEGRFDVERFSGDLRFPRQDPERVGASVGAADRVRILGQRRMRTSSVPYLLLVGLLLAEWMARRRKGLR